MHIVIDEADLQHCQFLHFPNNRGDTSRHIKVSQNPDNKVEVSSV